MHNFVNIFRNLSAFLMDFAKFFTNTRSVFTIHAGKSAKLPGFRHFFLYELYKARSRLHQSFITAGVPMASRTSESRPRMRLVCSMFSAAVKYASRLQMLMKPSTEL